MVHRLDLPAYCCRLLRDVIDRTGYPFALQEVESLEFDSELSIARNGRPYHSLLYLAGYRDHREHFLVNAAKKVLRLWDASPDERYVPMSGATRDLPAEDYAELKRKVRGVPGLEEMSRLLFHGIVRQLTSFPTDLRVERELSTELPEHREKQRHYLTVQVADFVPTLSERMLEAIPERPYRVSTAMNVAFAEAAAEIFGTRSPPAVRSHPSREKGEELLHHLKKLEKPGHPGDRAVTDAWARTLGLDGWYEWARHPGP